MDPKDRKRIEADIRNLEELLRRATPGNPDIRRWEQEIRNLKDRLRF